MFKWEDWNYKLYFDFRNIFHCVWQRRLHLNFWICQYLHVSHLNDKCSNKGTALLKSKETVGGGEKTKQNPWNHSQIGPWCFSCSWAKSCSIKFKREVPALRSWVLTFQEFNRVYQGTTYKCNGVRTQITKRPSFASRHKQRRNETKKMTRVLHTEIKLLSKTDASKTRLGFMSCYTIEY